MMKTTLLLNLLLIFSSVIFPATNQKQWVFKTNGKIYSSPANAGEMLFFGSGDSTFYVVNKNDGSKVWDFKTNGAIYSNPTIFKNLVYFGSADGNLYSLNILTGKLNWKFESKGEKKLDLWDYYLSSPKETNGMIYWGSGDGNIYVINAIDGKLVWSFQAGAIIHATPIISNDMVYFGDYNGNFYALNSKNGELIWKFKTIGDTYFPKGEIQKGATIDNGIVYFGSRDYNIYALNAATGTGHWNMKERGSWIIAEPLIYNGNVYFGTSDTHRFYSLDKTNGNPIWEIPLPMRVYGQAVVHNNIIFFGCFDGIMRGVEPETGKIVWEFQTEGSKQNYSKVYNKDRKFLEGFELYGKDLLETEKLILSLGSILSTPVVENNVIYFGSSDSCLYAVPLNSASCKNNPSDAPSNIKR